MKQLAAALLLITLYSAATAQTAFTSLQQVLQYADHNSLVNRQSQLQQQVSRKDEIINKSGLLPKLNVFGTGDYYPIITTQVIPAVVFGGSPDKYVKAQDRKS